MYTRTLTFEDYDGNERTEDFLFHLNKAEVIQWLTCNGGYTLDAQLTRLYKKSRGKDIMEAFEDLMKRSYGEKSLDGRKFEKSEAIWNEFRSTEAFSIIYTELVTDAKKAAAFINAIMPAKMTKEINAIMEENKDGIPDELKDYLTSDVLDKNGEFTTVEALEAEKAKEKEKKVVPIK